jgi:hypothetical protein
MVSIRAAILGWVRTVILMLIGLVVIFAAPFVLSMMVLSKTFGRMKVRSSVSRLR